MKKMIGPMSWVAVMTSLVTACGGDSQPSRYTVGVVVSGLQSGAQLVLQDNGGDSLTVTANGASTFATSLASGTAYAVTVSTQPTGEACYVTSGSGTVTSANAAVTVSCNWHVAYSVEGPNQAVAGFSIDPSTGRLTELPSSPVANQIYAFHAATDPGGKFIIAAESVGLGVAAGINSPSALSVFRIDAVTAALTPAAGSPFATPADLDANDVVVDPTGRRVYVSDLYSPVVYGFSLDGATGALQALPGSPWGTVNSMHFAFDRNLRTMTLERTGRFLYFSDVNRIHAFAIDAGTGGLTEVAGSPFFATNFDATQQMAEDPSGRFLYAVGTGINTFSIDANSGALTPVGSGATAAALGDMPNLVTDPSGHFVYAPGTSSVLGFAVDQATGALAALPGSPFPLNAPLAGSLFDVTVDPSGKFLYAAAGSQIFEFTLDAGTGALASIPGTPLVSSNHGDYIHIVVNANTSSSR
jgi:6-phosphogluconolactonase (cycloisomerase 2 family)